MKARFMAMFRRKPAFLAVLAGVVLVGVSLAIFGACTVWEEERDDAAEEFMEEAQTRYAVLAREIQAQMDLLQAGQAFYRASREVDRDEFRTFAHTVLREAPAMRALAWVPRIPSSQRESCERTARQNGARDFQIKEVGPEGTLIPAAERSEYFPVLFVEPYQGNEFALGFDVASSRARREALERAVKTDTVQASARVRLLQSPGDEWGCLIFAPVHPARRADDVRGNRERECNGFVLGVVGMKKMLEVALTPLSQVGIDVEILDQSAPAGEQLAAFHASRLRATEGGSGLIAPRDSGSPALEFTRELVFAGRTWQVRCVPAPGYFEARDGFGGSAPGGHKKRHPWVALTGGLVSTVLLATLLMILFRRGERIAQLVTERTSGLLRVNREMAAELRARAQVEARLGASLKQKEILLREIHHRVNNNLQVISSLLQIQTAHMEDPASLRLVKDMRNRVRSMALVYEKLQRSEDLAQIDFAEYLRSLAADLYRSCRGGRDGVQIRFELENVVLNLDTAIPCGLIATELMTNTLKYAFPAVTGADPALPAAALLTVGAHLEDDGRISLTVKDNGIGLPPNVELDSPQTIGLQIVNLLVEQLNGVITLDRTGGTRFTVTFRELQYESRGAK